MKTLTLIATGSLLALGAAAQAVTIANWTFETSVPTTSGPHAAEAGVNAASSFASANIAASGAAFTNPVGNGSAESFSVNNIVIGDYYQFSFSTAGYENITFGWDQARSSTGAADFSLAVSVDGGTFTTLVPTYTVLQSGGTGAPATWSGTTYNPIYTFSPAALTGADDSSSVVVRLIANVASSAATGTGRVDNIIVDGTEVVPEPATMAILGLGVAAIARRKRK